MKYTRSTRKINKHDILARMMTEIRLRRRKRRMHKCGTFQMSVRVCILYTRRR